MKLRNLDILGLIVSFLCLLNCSLGTFLWIIIPSIYIFVGHGFLHVLTVFISLPIALMIFIKGYKSHQSKTILLLAMLGVLTILSTVIFKKLWRHHHNDVATIGSVTLFIAHFANFLLVKSKTT